ncbi:hypothetical protein [Blautia sp.]
MILDRYYYNQLSVSQQILYKKIYDAMLRYEEYIICGENYYTEEDFNEILNAVKMDNPNVFYVQNNFSIEKTSWGLIKLHLNYFFSKVDKENLSLEIEKYLNSMFLNIDTEEKEQEQIVKDVHDFLITGTQVKIKEDIPELEKCAVIETFLENKMTTQGIAYAYKYILNSADIKCSIVCGSVLNADGRSCIRAWNRIKLYGEERYIDIYEDAVKSNDQKICYDYFGLTDEMILKDHSINVPLESFEDSSNDIKTKKDDFSPVQEFLGVINSAELESLSVDKVVKILENMPPDMMSDDTGIIIEKFVQKLKNLNDIEKQYLDEKEVLEKDIMVHIPYLLRILGEYYRYKKYSAATDLTLMLYEKLSVVIDTLMKTMQYNMNVFWNHHADEMINDMSQIQQDLINEKKNRTPCPVDVESLNEDSDINDFILVLEHLKIYGLSQNINEQIIRTLEELKRLQQAITKNSYTILPIDNFKNYYLPEAIKLIFLYDEYEDEGISEQRLNDLYENIQISLTAVNNAINSKLDEIQLFETMETEARAKALADIIGQDGFVDSAYKINI